MQNVQVIKACFTSRQILVPNGFSLSFMQQTVVFFMHIPIELLKDGHSTALPPFFSSRIKKERFSRFWFHICLLLWYSRSRLFQMSLVNALNNSCPRFFQISKNEIQVKSKSWNSFLCYSFPALLFSPPELSSTMLGVQWQEIG